MGPTRSPPHPICIPPPHRWAGVSRWSRLSRHPRQPSVPRRAALALQPLWDGAGCGEGAAGDGDGHHRGGGQPPRPPAPSRAPQPLVGSPWGTPWVLTTPARPAGPGCPGLPGGPWGHRGGVQLGAMPPTPGTCPHSPPRTVPVLPVGSEPLTMSPGGPCRPWGPMGPGSPCGKQRDEWGGGHGTHPTLGSRVPPPPPQIPHLGPRPAGAPWGAGFAAVTLQGQRDSGGGKVAPGRPPPAPRSPGLSP